MKKWLILILLTAAVLRFYRLPEYLQFLGDEGRDVLVVKRMVVDHQWTLLGPTASVGGFYTGPIYYYFMIPFLWAFRLDPVGPAVMAALFGLATIVLIYYFCREFFNPRVGLIAAFLMAISPKMVDISRFSWNPNPVPFFTVLTFLLLYLGSTRHKKVYTLLAGLSIGILYQLHYTDLIFIPITAVVSLFVFPLNELLTHYLLLAGGFILGDSLFLLFELRHGFPNTRSVWEFVSRGGQTIGPRSYHLLNLFDNMTRILYETVLSFRGTILNTFYLTSLAAFALWVVSSLSNKSNRSKIAILVAWLVIGVYGIGSYRGQILEHYYGYLYPLPFIFLGLLGSWLTREKVLLPVFILGISVLSYFEVKSLYFWRPPNNLVDQTKTVDKMVLALTGDRPFNFALVAPGNSDHAYRYFLELWGRPPVTILNPDLDPKRRTVTDQLIVVCEQRDCKPLGHPLWEIAGFGWAEINIVVTGPTGIKIFRLVHYTGK